MRLWLHKGRWDLQIRLYKCLILLLNLNPACFIYSVHYCNVYLTIWDFLSCLKCVSDRWANEYTSSVSVSWGLRAKPLSWYQFYYRLQNTTGVSSSNWFQTTQEDLIAISSALSLRLGKKALSVNSLSKLLLVYLL